MGKGESKTKGDARNPSKADYLERLASIEIELNELARWLAHTGQRMAVLIEGRDTAGKGGVINAIADCLNPRQCRVVALPKPTEREQSQWYFQRYVQHLPAAGEIVLFDRSWYNRAGVERVMGYCTPEQTRSFLKQAPVFEQLLTDDGILLRKYWLTVDQQQQEERFAERLSDPLKRWKLSPIDLQARSRYDDYTQARHAMLKATHREHAPWTLVDFNHQRRGRLALIRHLLDSVPDTSVPEAKLDFSPLPGVPMKESFKGPLRPI
jgi:polyphosphate kinase